MGLTKTEQQEFATYLMEQEATNIHQDTIVEGWGDYNGDPDEELSDDDLDAVDNLIMNAKITVKFEGQ